MKTAVSWLTNYGCFVADQLWFMIHIREEEDFAEDRENSPKIPYSAIVMEVEKLSGIRIRLTTKRSSNW